eukprot:gene6758-378_t
MSHFDIFLSHDWGTDQEGRNNHDRVAMLNTMLKAHGLSKCAGIYHEKLPGEGELRAR